MPDIPAELSPTEPSSDASMDLTVTANERRTDDTPSEGSESTNSCTLKIFHWVVWVWTFNKPVRISVIDNAHRRLPEHEDIPPISEISYVLVWLENGEVWMRSDPMELWTVIPTTAKRALVRLPEARNCLTFSQEHRLLHEQLNIVAPTQWKYVSLLENVRMHNCGALFTIVAYGEASHRRPEAPKIFVLRLTKFGELRWRDFPRLLTHVLGTADDEKSYPPALFHAWNPNCQKWMEVRPDDEYLPEGKFDFALIRHKSNTRAPGLSRWLDHLTAQKIIPVGRRYTVPVYNPFPWPVKLSDPPPPIGSPSALSANYLRSAYTISPRPETTLVHPRDEEGLKSLRSSASAPDLRLAGPSVPSTSRLDDEAGEFFAHHLL